MLTVLSSLKWRSLDLRRSDARLCMRYKQSNELAIYEFDKLQTQDTQTHYMNADVTLACERCCVTNGYIQRLVWDRSVFLKRDKKCYVFK